MLYLFLSLKILSASEIWYHLLCLLNVSHVVEETTSLPSQVTVGLVPVQMAVTDREELEHPVSQST